MDSQLLLVALVGSFAGFTSGATSVGYGTLVILPLLYFGLQGQMIVASVLISVTVISIIAGLLHWRGRRFDPTIISGLMIGGMVGAYLGSSFSISHLSEPALRVAIASVVLLGGVFYFIRSRTSIRLEAGAALPWIVLLAAFVGGVSTGALGVGWGYITIPTLIFLGIDTAELIGGSLLARAFMSASGASNYLSIVTPEMMVIILTLTVSGVLAAGVGVAVARRIEPQRIRKILMGWIMVLAVIMLARTVIG